MWFNHSTAIFAPRNRNESRKSVQLARSLRPLDGHLLDDLGMAKGDTASDKDALTNAVLHESRFTGFRGDLR